MPPRRTKAPSLVDVVTDYCRRVTPVLVDQQRGNAVSSALGIWLLLAACASGSRGEDRKELEEVLGCSASEAAHHLGRFFDAPPPALTSALSLWVDEADMVPALLEWMATLPPQLESGGIPSQAEADAWTRRHTLGLIDRFPTAITPSTRMLLTSVLATRVSWERLLAPEPADRWLPAASPWRGAVEQVLLDRSGHSVKLLARTEAAGVVAVHVGQAVEDLVVLSVSADPELPPDAVFAAAYEVAAAWRVQALPSITCSLFDLPVGRGHSWEITEEEIPTSVAGARQERIRDVVLVQWTAQSRWDLTRSADFGVVPAIATLVRTIGPSALGDAASAVQVAKASYTASGFEAAALADLEVRAAVRRPDRSVPAERGVRRLTDLYFDHPHAAVALAGEAPDLRRDPAAHDDLFGLPLFSAWVAEPQEPD